MSPTRVVLFLAIVCGAASAQAQSTQFDSAGNAVHQPVATLPMAVDMTAAPEAFADLPAIANRAAEAWNAVPGITRLAPYPGSIGTIGYDGSANATNRSGVIVSTTGLPGSAPDALAITLVTTRIDTGEVVDADVVFNAREYPFAELGPRGLVGSENAPYDIQNTLTHELGHVLGLVEDPTHPTATMYPSSQRGEVSKRQLSEFDVSSVQRAYRGVTLRDGDASGASAHASTGGCGGARVVPANGAPSIPWGVGALLLVAAIALRPRLRRLWILAGIFAMLIAAMPVPENTPQGPHRVIARDARWSGRLILTRATLRADDGSERSIELLGGRVGNYEMRVYGTASGTDLEPGARVHFAGERVVRIEH